jgi:hypothetical protein
MDIICPRCGEPCDAYELHDAPGGYDEGRYMFFKYGCGVAFNGKPCEKVESEAATASAVLANVLGDDVDGIASMLEDFGY